MILSVSNETPKTLDAEGFEALTYTEVNNKRIDRPRKVKAARVPTLPEIRNIVMRNGGTYKKLKMYLNGKNAYEVNGVTMTKADMIERFQRGEL